MKNRIYDLRKEKGFSQSALADAVDVTQTAVSHWENGKNMPDTKQAVLLANFFGVTVDYLLGESNSLGLRCVSKWNPNIETLWNKAQSDAIKRTIIEAHGYPESLLDEVERLYSPEHNKKTPSAKAESAIESELIELLNPLSPEEQAQWFRRLKAMIEAEKETGQE